MASAFLAGLVGDVITNGVGSLINAGANAVNQKVEYDFNKQLQMASFKHDKEMLQSQVLATKQLQQEMMNIRQGVLTAGGFSPADAARGAVNAPMTKILDWNGTRYWAPNSMKTTSYSGQFSSSPVHKSPAPSHTALPKSRLQNDSASVYSFPSSASSQSTHSTVLSAGTGSSRSTSTSTATPTLSRTSDWVRGQNERLSPFMDGALQTAFVTPPSSKASSNGTVSTVPKAVLDSWTPMFNTHRQPLFAHLRRRGESQI
ncbi:VP2 [Norovirus GII]|uniref:VP2 n=1 Tax=Norovirus GII TaxID=122929 RepID=A0A2U9GLZ6_NORV|nr:VP2 [Norovirus GII]AWR17594.1 VP2 [Norovirus GII]AWR17657.1 VP2 [Norovirus GII]AWR17678.1 VP2 [Norovirus GII]